MPVQYLLPDYVGRPDHVEVQLEENLGQQIFQHAGHCAGLSLPRLKGKLLFKSPCYETFVRKLRKQKHISNLFILKINRMAAWSDIFVHSDLLSSKHDDQLRTCCVRKS